MSSKYMVAICDILGFTQHVRNNTADRVVSDVLGRLRKSLYHSIHKNGFPKDVPPLSELQNHAHIGLALFSDTILLYTREDTDESIRSFVNMLSWLVFETMFMQNTRIRCGVDYGLAVIEPENSIYVGIPIIEAFKLEKKQQWSGGAFTEAACNRIPHYARDGNDVNWWVVPYEVPLKDCGRMQTLAIDWTWGLHDRKFDLSWSHNSKEPTPNDWQSNFDICEKWQNTKNFHDSVCVWCGNRKHTQVR